MMMLGKMMKVDFKKDIKKLRDENTDDLMSMLSSAKKELFDLRCAKVLDPNMPGKYQFPRLRKFVARACTVLRERELKIVQMNKKGEQNA